MELKSCPLLSAVLLILVASFHYQVSAVSRSDKVGDYRPIKDLNSTLVLEIARFAVSEYNKEHGASLQFVKVVKGESQVVEGTNYKLVIIANDAAAGNAPGNYLAVVYDKPWEHVRQLTSFTKLLTVSRSPKLGGYQPIKDLNSPLVLEIARFAVSEYNKKNGAHLQFVKVVKGESQVVAGMNYKLVIIANDAAAGNASGYYQAVVWDKPWEHFRQLTSFTKVGPIVGGYQPIKDLNSPLVLEIARFAVSEYNKKHGANLQFVKVVKGESQVVAGTNYKLVIIANDAAAGNAPGTYQAVVYDKPWEHIRQLTSFTKVSAVSPTIPGGYQPIKDLNSPLVLEIAKFAVSEYNKQNGAYLQFVKVVKGESQVVAGTNYKLVITANDAAAGNAPGNYLAVVWDKPWEHFRQLTSFTKV